MIPGGEGARFRSVGPVETLRGALGATRANGEPDWPTRVTAAKALAALRPEELEPKEEEAQIIVYDLPPGTVSVLHRARKGEAEASASPAEAPPEELPAQEYTFFYDSAEGKGEVIGEWLPAGRDRSPDAVVSLFWARDRETAERWRAALAAGVLQQPAGEEP